jgi:hypothetical protein
MVDMRDKNETGKHSQDLVPVTAVRDGIAVLTDGTLRATLIVSSLNFALKSEDEQNAIIFAYQDFLNALDFPVQITVVSRKLDITPYLEEMKERQARQANELLQLQMGEYINFVAELVKGSDIMTKTFLVTVPFSLQQSTKDNFAKRIFKGLQGAARRSAQLQDVEFEHYKSQLLQRVEQVAVGLRNIGLRLIPLQTQELLELYYNALNPVTSRNQPLANIAQLDIQETEPAALAELKKRSTPWVKRR